MRKGQVKILERAKHYNYSDACIQFLSRTDYPLKILEQLFHSLYYCQYCDEFDSDVAPEAGRDRSCHGVEFRVEQYPAADIACQSRAGFAGTVFVLEFCPGVAGGGLCGGCRRGAAGIGFQLVWFPAS